MISEQLAALFDCIFYTKPCESLFISDYYTSEYGICETDLDKIVRQLINHFSNNNITQDSFKNKLFALLISKGFLNYSREIKKNKMETNIAIKKCFDNILK